MPVSALNLGVDFLYARVHGWWSRSAHGEFLETLTRAATEENFFHLLQSRGVLAVTGPERVLEQLVLRHYDRLGQLGAKSDAAFQHYTAVLRETLERENYKTILNYRFFPERESHPAEALVRFPSRTVRESDLLTLLDATGTDQFIRLLPQTSHREEIAKIVRQLDRDRDIMRAECAIDNLSYRSEIAAISGLSGETGSVLRFLRGRQIDHVNIITLLRNANFYRLDAQGLSYAWIDGGREVPRRLFDHLASAATPQAVIDALPATYHVLLRHGLEGADKSLGALDNLLHCQLARAAREVFYDSANPRRALAAYPLLLEQETINLSRIYEGIRFNLPARDIAAMMIR